LGLSTDWTDTQIVVEGIEGKPLRMPKEEASHQGQSHMVVEGRESHLDFAENLGMVVVAAVDFAGTGYCVVVYSNYPPFLLQILSLCFFHHGHDQPCSPPRTLDL
jgi:hypothetical protein